MSEADPPTSPRAPIRAPRSVERAILPSDATLPPAPPGCRYVPVKWLGIVIADDDLRKRIDQRFHKPMIILALLVLPLLMLDYVYVREAGKVTHDWKFWLVLGGLTVVWIAFTFEFVVKIAIAEDRLEYLRRNWLDLIIIVIPVLRPLRVASVARTTRVFTLRGVGFKFARYVFTLFIGLEATNRISERLGFKRRKARLDPEEMTRCELIAEIKRLRQLDDDWNHWYAEQQNYLAENGRSTLPASQPCEPAPSELPRDSATNQAHTLRS